MQMIEILLKYILWYEFLNDLDAQSDFDKKIITKKPVKSNHSYLKYALTSLQKNRGLHHFYLLASQKMAPLACYFITNLKMILTYYYIKRSQRHPLTAICALLKTTEWKLLFIQYPKSGKFLRISRTFFFRFLEILSNQNFHFETYRLVQWLGYTFYAIWSKFDSIPHQKYIQFAGPNCIWNGVKVSIWTFWCAQKSTYLKI